MWFIIIFGFLIWLFLLVFIYYLKEIDMFQKVVLMVFVTVLIWMLTSIAYSLNSIQSSFTYTSNTCPDYWKYDNSTGNGLCVIPVNGKNTGLFKTNGLDITKLPAYNANLGAIDFNSPEWKKTGKTELCSKKDWANSNNIVWDGVTNNSTTKC
jgi:hypothetical protein